MVEDVDSPNAEGPPRHVPHEHRGEGPGQGDPQGGQAARPLPRLRQRPRHAGRRSHRLAQIVKALKAIKYDGDVVIESFTTDVKVIARAAAIWRQIEPTRDDIAAKGVKFLKKAFAR